MQDDEKITEESLAESINSKLDGRGLEELKQVLFTKREFAYLCSLSLRQVERIVEADHVRPVKHRPMQFNFECIQEYLDYLAGRAMGLY